MRPKIPAASKEALTAAQFAPHVSRATWAAGVIYLFGTLVDLGTLWIGQRQPGVQWEFVAVTNTVEAWPRMVLAVGLIYLGLYVGGSVSKGLYRLLGLLMLLLGLLAVAFGGLMALNYLSVSGSLQAESVSLVRSAVVKTEALCALYAVLLIPLGVFALLGPKHKRSS